MQEKRYLQIMLCTCSKPGFTMYQFLYRHQQNILPSNEVWIPIFGNLSDARYDAFWIDLAVLVFLCANATVRDELMPKIVVLDKWFYICLEYWAKQCRSTSWYLNLPFYHNNYRCCLIQNYLKTKWNYFQLLKIQL